MTELSTAAVSPVAPWWLPGGHLQTIWRKLAAAPSLIRQRQRIELADGDFIDVDHLHAGGSDVAGADRPLVFLLHGLAGCSASPYILAMQHTLHGAGYDSVAMNLRGCSGDHNRLAIAYHSGCSGDVEEVMAALMARQQRPLVVIGYSLGANVLVKWLSETRFKNQLCAAVSVSNPFSLDLCCAQMKTGMAYWYGRYFLRRLRTDLQCKRDAFVRQGRDDQVQAINRLGALDGLQTLWDFDDAVTAPLHGFAGAEDYYQRCSSRRFIADTPVPTLVVHSHNDPIIPLHALPTRDQTPAHVSWEILPSGGHVGFAMKGHNAWLEHRILRFIEQAQLS
ncbi:YheT family hydrolase [Pseudohongiella sp.]|uniref:AB hydrolase-1 domain-containing protein n=1 Tax=marine sediment metagenome TaxID=412755 RepID=A0A0F9YVS8_9ZZZZ|nr:alpha/beta fold hydrolase [Pseudohongiella sp.]HDZ08044.1 alpha/beta fold hydrolase [Pseudohongiella sp.]HEA64113.1 alpha/beta fold hydrolase [Pseudohongiella sp.]